MPTPTTQADKLSAMFCLGALVLGLICSNIPSFYAIYLHWVKTTLTFGGLWPNSPIHLQNFMNDGVMSFFFLMIGMELKTYLWDPSLEKSKLIFPMAAAVSAVLVPASIYLAFNHGLPTQKGWAIPIASDTAFILTILAFFPKVISTQLRQFVVYFSVIDDIIAILVVMIVCSNWQNLWGFSIVLACLLFLGWCNRRDITSTGIYLVCGVVLWAAMVLVGIHGTLAGIVLGLFIPIQTDHGPNPFFHHLEQILKRSMALVIIPCFVFLNTEVVFANIHWHTLSQPLSAGIILGLVLGKPLGILVVYGLWAIMKLPAPIRRHQGSNGPFYAIAVLSSIGFTFSLFIANMTFSNDARLEMSRAAIIIASSIAALIGMVILARINRQTDQSTDNGCVKPQ